MRPEEQFIYKRGDLVWAAVFMLAVSIVPGGNNLVSRTDIVAIGRNVSLGDKNKVYPSPACRDPYGICKRESPTGNQFEKIIPPRVCIWKRIFYKAPTPVFDGEARYTNGKDSVFMLFSLQRDAASISSVFQTIKKEAIEGDDLVAKEEPPADPAWIQVGRGKHVFFAWTRRNYVFSCESLHGWSAVNAFMKCFPH